MNNLQVFTGIFTEITKPRFNVPVLLCRNFKISAPTSKVTSVTVPDWIRIQLGLWIRILIREVNIESKKEKNKKIMHQRVVCPLWRVEAYRTYELRSPLRTSQKNYFKFVQFWS
jgi:hypothetical protein